MAVCLLGALVLAACGRTSATATPSPANVYGGTPTVEQVTSLLGDSSNWWPGPPTFGVRPLDISNLAPEQRFSLTLRYSHIGTPETLSIDYVVWDTTAHATNLVTNTQAAIGSTLAGPSAGDQVVYFDQMLAFAPAPYVSDVMLRVGQTVISIDLHLVDGFAPTSLSGRLAARIATRLKSSLAGTLGSHPSDSINYALLPPAGPYFSFLGAANLPIEVLEAMLQAPAPGDDLALLGRLGVTDMLYGDFTLDNDTHMEVQTSTLTFPSSAAATEWIYAEVGASNLDQNGVFSTYDSLHDQYLTLFTAGTHGVVMICKSASEFEAASKSCETPQSLIITGWRTDLNSAS